MESGGSECTVIVAVIAGVIDRQYVGARVTSAGKDGRDVGELLGLGPVGVLATTDTDRLLACEPEVVVYAPRTPDLEEVCALLESGVDVVTTAFAFHPRRLPPAQRDRLHEACATGRSTYHASGLNPGGFSAAVPLALSGHVRRLEQVRVQERADWSVYESTEITFDQMRFGSPPAEVTLDAAPSLARTSDLFVQQAWLLGDSLHADLDEVVTEHEVAPAPCDVEVCGRVLEQGTTGGQRFRWVGRAGGRERVVIEAIWTVGDVDAAWPTLQHGWTVTLEGEPSLQAHLITLASFTHPREMVEHVRAASVATAMHVVNAIPAVRAAPPGVVTAADLPVVRSLQGFGGYDDAIPSPP